MLKTQSLQQARSARRALSKDTFEGFVTDLIGSHLERQTGEQAFLVEQAANWVTPPHYHLEHQFQIVIAGNGTIGRHQVGPLSVHYAAPETGYGPVEAGEFGLTYLNLRVSADSGAWYLHKPGSRERMQRDLQHEQSHAASQNRLSGEALAGLSQTSIESLIEPRADGLAVFLINLAPGQDHQFDCQPGSAGRFYVITQGEAAISASTLQSLAVVYCPASDQISLKPALPALKCWCCSFRFKPARPSCRG